MVRKNPSIELGDAVRRVRDTAPMSVGWGHISWLIGESETPGAEQTFGVVTILSGKRNPLHLHPNCEDLLYVVEGQADHKLGDEMYHLEPGDVIRIPQGVPHWAEANGATPLVAVISFSAADRRTENLEDTGDIA